MDSISILKNRFTRLEKLDKDIRAQMIVLEMQEKDGADVSDDRVALDELQAKNQSSLANTLEAIEKLQELAKEE